MSSVATIKCGGCTAAIMDKRFLKCYLCHQIYDLFCAGVTEACFISEMSLPLKNTWKCQVCKCREPKGDNTNTPVRTASGRADAEDFQLGGMSSSANLEHDDSVASVDRDRSTSDNITVRRGRHQEIVNMSGAFRGNDTINDDILYFENIRSIVREELDISVNKRLANIISNAVSEQITCRWQPAIDRILDRVSVLEAIVSKLVAGNPSSGSDSGADKRLCDEGDYKKQGPLQSQKQTSTKNKNNQPKQPGGKSDKSTNVKSFASVLNMNPNVDAASFDPPSGGGVDGPRITGEYKDASEDSDGWSEVKRNRSRIAFRRATRGSAAAGSTQLEASVWLRHIHLFYVKLGTTEDQVKSHLKSITGSVDVKVESLKSRGSYASFKISVPSGLFDKTMTPENWPLNVCVKPWRQPFRPKKDMQMPQTQ